MRAGGRDRVVYRALTLIVALAVLLAGQPMAAAADEDSGLLASVFPAPLPEWTAGAIEIERPASPTLGGTLRASRRYQRGEVSIDVRIYLTSPWTRPLRVVLDNPELISPGDEIVEIGGRAALQSSGPPNARIVVVENGALVEVEAVGADDLEPVRQYAALVRHEVLARVQSQELRRAP